MPMLDHASIGVSDIARAGRFYDAVLGALGHRRLAELEISGIPVIAYGGPGDGAPSFYIAATEAPVPADPRSRLHLCFAATSREAVERFHQAALGAGGGDNGAPGLRAQYGADYYAAFVVDPDGYRLEAHAHVET